MCEKISFSLASARPVSAPVELVKSVVCGSAIATEAHVLTEATAEYVAEPIFQTVLILDVAHRSNRSSHYASRLVPSLSGLNWRAVITHKISGSLDGGIEFYPWESTRVTTRFHLTVASVWDMAEKTPIRCFVQYYATVTDTMIHNPLELGSFFIEKPLPGGASAEWLTDAAGLQESSLWLDVKHLIRELDA